MNSVLYMLRKTVKNEIIDTFRHPMKLMIYGFLVLSLIYAVIAGFKDDSFLTRSKQDIRILYGGYLALLHFISVPIMLKGLSTGTSFFSMGDVNNLFVAPISDKKILLYGIGRQLASMLFLAVCFSAYGSIAVRMFELSISQALLLVGGILLMLLIVQLITLLLFCICSGHHKRASILKYFIYFIPVYSLFVVGIKVFPEGLSAENFFAAISQPVLEFTPVVGWVHGAVFGIMNGNIIRASVYCFLLLIGAVLSLIVFRFIHLDYYEDVLSQAESYYEFRDSLRTGTVSENMMLGSRKIKVRKTGIQRGSGASAIFFKHLKEGSRRSRFMFFNINTIVLIGIALLVASIIDRLPVFAAGSEIEKTVMYLSAMAICSYVQFFFSAAGDWVKELGKPYVFLIPDNPVRKLIMAGATSIIKPFIDGFISFFLVFIIFKGNIFDAITSVIAYGSFGCVYIAANILAQRIVGGSGNGGVFITFYMSFIVILMIPGIILGILSLANMGGMGLSHISATLFGLPVSAWNIFVSFMIFLMCRNLLDNIE